MKYLLTLLISLPWVAKAQLWSNTFIDSTGTYTVTFHSNKQVSTITFWDKDNRWGQAWILSADKKVLAFHHTRKVGGHASLYCQYHPNGQVSKAEFSDQPDGGIQFYRCQYEFNEKGDRSYFNQERHEHEWVMNTPPPPPLPEYPSDLIRHFGKLSIHFIQLNNPTSKTQRLSWNNKPIVLTPKQKIRIDSSGILIKRNTNTVDASFIRLLTQKGKIVRAFLLGKQSIKEDVILNYVLHEPDL
jgi:hypothetical protein